MVNLKEVVTIIKIGEQLILYQRGYFELSLFELVLTMLLLIFVLMKKDKFIMIVLGAKVFIHEMVFAELFWKLIPWTNSMQTFSFTMLKQIVYIILLIWMIHSEKRADYKKVCIGMFVLLCIELFSAFIYYPQFMDYFYNGCLNCNKSMSKRSALLLLIAIVSAPFSSADKRLIVTIVQFGILFIQILIHKKDKVKD